MYQFAYSEICEESLFHNASPGRREISDAIELIEAVEAAPRRSHEWLGVLSDFRKLWLAILDDLQTGAPDAIGAPSPLPKLADSVLHEIERCRFQKAQTFASGSRGMLPQ